MNRILRSLLLTGIMIPLFFGQGKVQASADLTNEDLEYSTTVRTILFYKEGFEMSAPVMLLNSQERLVLSFDDLAEDLRQYRFTIRHCTADWSESSDLLPTDYIAGFGEDRIEDYSYSFNTTVSYIHYSLVFPTAGLRPKISGNYLLIVYPEDPGDPSFTRRFRVVETSPVGITGKIGQSVNIQDRLSRQEVDFTVSLNGMQVSDPVHDLKIMITQNDRWDNAVRNAKPRFVRPESLDFTFDERNTFNGGNEFRAFDTKSLVYRSERIGVILYDYSGIQVYLLDDPPRPLRNYVTDKDINGRMFIKNEDHATNSDIEADYTWIHFTLPVNAMLPDRTVHILGALTGWQINDSTRMDWDPAGKAYTKKILFKQGYYNYLYITRDKRTGATDEGFFEGNHWETENEYTVWVYYREPGGLYDRLIAVQNLNSASQKG